MVVRAPAAREPWTVPAAPASDCISMTFTVVPKMFFRPGGSPLVHVVGHGAGRGDGVDAGYLGKGVADICRSIVAVHGFELSCHRVPYFLPFSV